MKPVILTLSRFPDLFARLKQSVDEHEPGTPCVVVVDGPEQYPRGVDGYWYYESGVEPFCFARNANLGLRDCEGHDVLLINDDCCLTMPLLDTLQNLCVANPQIGILSPQIAGGVGNVLQRANGSEALWIESHERLAFVCVYIPAKTRKLVGLLNESFVGYGGEDVDFCRRVQAAGLTLAVTPRATVVHGFGPNNMSTSFDRVIGRAARNKSMAEMLKLERTLR